MPDGTEYICEKAFSKSHISAIKFPDSLKEIGPFAFDCC
ncbi:leucine-rich repeat protein, partial [Bacteroides sp. MSSM.1001136sp1_RTP21357st2_E1_RTP21359_211015]